MGLCFVGTVRGIASSLADGHKAHSTAYIRSRQTGLDETNLNNRQHRPH